MELHCSIWQPLSHAQGRDNAKSPNLSNALLENGHLQQLAEEFVEHVNQVSTRGDPDHLSSKLADEMAVSQTLGELVDQCPVSAVSHQGCF